MKKSFIFALLLGIITLGQAKPQISDLSYPTAVDLFELYEISFQMESYANPYDPKVIDVYAEFTAPDGHVLKVNGFYYEGYRFEKYKGYEKAQAESCNNGWRVRFTPDQEGVWHFTLKATDQNGSFCLDSIGPTDFSFTCNAVSSATGFITKANSRFLKRDVVTNGQRKHHSFFPIGPNIAWYICKSYYDFATPFGIYEYEQRIDSLEDRANYIRIWLNRPQYLSLYGFEYTQLVNGKPTMYFDSTLNQKDAAELDHIISYAAKKGISIMPCIFTYGDLNADPRHDGKLDKSPADWRLNPYNTVLGLKTPTDFFTDKEARRISHNLVRYIVARWGYATNIVAWELWNEISNMGLDKNNFDQYTSIVTKWHDDMAQHIRTNDPFCHPITTSIGYDSDNQLFSSIYNSMDIVQKHHYASIHKAKSKEQVSHNLYLLSISAHETYPDKLFFIGEFGFGNTNPQRYLEKDPYCIDLHNTLWSTLFSGMMGTASFWQWYALEKCGTNNAFRPVLTFCKNLPIPSETFEPRTTGENSKKKKSAIIFPNGLETYYMANAAEDTLYGWSQDTAFTYQALRRLTDKEGKNGHFDDNGVFDPEGYVYTLATDKKPRPSSKRNEISLPISNQEVGTQYIIRWFNGETGVEMTSARTKAVVQKKWLSNMKFITFDFPASIRDIKNQTINNTFGDAAFIITLDKGTQKESNTEGIAPNKTKTIRIKRGSNQ